jgi:hypothetical protein
MKSRSIGYCAAKDRIAELYQTAENAEFDQRSSNGRKDDRTYRRDTIVEKIAMADALASRPALRLNDRPGPAPEKVAIRKIPDRCSTGARSETTPGARGRWERIIGKIQSLIYTRNL